MLACNQSFLKTLTNFVLTFYTSQQVAMHFDKYLSDEATKDIVKFESKTRFELWAKIAFVSLSQSKKPPPNQMHKKKMTNIIQLVRELPFKFNFKSLEENQKNLRKSIFI